MRQLTFVQMTAIGPWHLPRTGSLADLVLALPYVVGEEIPPRPALNDVLIRGRLDAGMSGGCIWKPLELSKADFWQLVEELQRLGTRPVHDRYPGGRPFSVPDDPEFVPLWGVSTVADRLRSPFKPSQRREAEPQPTADERCSATYERWLDALPVGALYVGYLDA